MGSKTPNPGSAEAIERGCKCPVIDNHYGKGVPHGKDGAPLFWISERCSMHMTDKALEAALPGEAEVVGLVEELREQAQRFSDPTTEMLTDAADALQAMQARAEKAEMERDRAKMQAKACSYRIRYQREQLRRLQPKDRLERPKWLANFSIGQHINKLHSLWRGEAARAEAAEARVKELEEALKPFARHLDEMKFDLDNQGNELPDEQTVGWVYVTNGDFRRARTALKGDHAHVR